MKTLILSSADVRRIVRYVGLDAFMDALTARLTQALLAFDPKTTIVPLRAGFHYGLPHPGLVEWMPCMHVGHQVLIKVVGYHPYNPSHRALPTILSTISAYDTASGHLRCMADGTFLTALRTGAASAVASRLMAKPASKTLGLIGTGAQAVTQLHALWRTFDLEHILLYDANPDVLRTFPERVSCFLPGSVPVETAPLDEVASRADILCTATSIGVGEGPLFHDLTLQPWVHINAVGSDFPGKVELPVTLLRNSFVCPDFAEQAFREGECQQLTPETIGPSLYELVQHQAKYRFVQHEQSVFDSTGWALEDYVALELLANYAATLNVGSYVQIESISEDAQNPYGFLADAADALPLSPAARENGYAR